MDTLLKKFELAANIAIIIIALLFGVILFKTYFLNAPSEKQIPVGAKLSLSDVDWKKNDQTLLLVINKDCHFCTESAKFYQRLVEKAKEKRQTQLIAVLPQDKNEARSYLNNLGVSIETINRLQPDSLAVTGTPTLILVDSVGVVKRVWVGKLPSDKELEVLEQI